MRGGHPKSSKLMRTPAEPRAKPAPQSSWHWAENLLPCHIIVLPETRATYDHAKRLISTTINAICHDNCHASYLHTWTPLTPMIPHFNGTYILVSPLQNMVNNATG